MKKIISDIIVLMIVTIVKKIVKWWRSNQQPFNYSTSVTFISLLLQNFRCKYKCGHFNCWITRISNRLLGGEHRKVGVRVRKSRGLEWYNLSKDLTADIMTVDAGKWTSFGQVIWCLYYCISKWEQSSMFAELCCYQIVFLSLDM